MRRAGPAELTPAAAATAVRADRVAPQEQREPRVLRGVAVTAASVGPWPPSERSPTRCYWQDLADLEVIRVDDTFYYTASTMHYSPGAPILRSYDLVNWEMVGHSVPKLDFGAKYDMSGGYARTSRASGRRRCGYRESNQTFYWIGCIEFSRTYVFTATSVTGPWQQHPQINNCYYDAGLLIDDDDTMYVAYGATNISVAQLSADGPVAGEHAAESSPRRATSACSRARASTRSTATYYIVLTHPPDAEYVLRSSTGPFGPYTLRTLVAPVGSPVAGSGHPHQGGLVETQNGDWYYMSFIDAYPGGRIPVLAPVTWADGWPTVTLDQGAWGASYPYPNVPRPPAATKPPTGIDTFADAALAPDWEWNHNPDDSKWSAGGKLTLQTATVTNDLVRGAQHAHAPHPRPRVDGDDRARLRGCRTATMPGSRCSAIGRRGSGSSARQARTRS